MQSFRHDFGHALSVDAEALGEPGNRRFRLLVRSSSQTASIWMEKQQLAGIGAWIEETQQRLDRERPSAEPDVEPAPFDEAFEVEFRASQIGLGFSEEEEQFGIQAFDIEVEERVPSFRCFISRGQARVLSRKIASVVAAGRPICPLCEMPMDPEGHICPRSNGHHAGLTV
jgi:uncharacterized repeat protein (TIGR03847 family)